MTTGTMPGYHGTTSKDADTIIRTGFKKSTGANHWLGEGVYFFADLPPLADGLKEASYWCKSVGCYPSWAVLRSVINKKNQLDLVSSREDRELFKRIRNKLAAVHRRACKSEEDFLKTVVFLYIDKQCSFSSYVALINPSKMPIYLVLDSQIQVCVKDLRVIEKTEIVNQGEA